MPSLVLLAACVLLLWNGAFALSGAWGVWVPILVVASLLDALALRLEPALLRPKLLGLRAVGIAAAATVVQVGATYLLYRPLSVAFAPMRVEVVELYRLMGHPSAWQAWLAIPFVVASEEIIYRGALQSLIGKRTGTAIAIVLASTIYALAHVASGNWALVGVAFVCGIFWGSVRAASRSLFAPVVCHLLWDWAILVAVPLAA